MWITKKWAFKPGLGVGERPLGLRPRGYFWDLSEGVSMVGSVIATEQVFEKRAFLSISLAAFSPRADAGSVQLTQAQNAG